MRIRLIAAATLVVAVFASVAVALGATGAPAKPPTADPFYHWSGSLQKVEPGTVLRRRTVTLNPAVGGVTTATQLLYRTTTQLGQPAVTVTTIIAPPTQSSGPPKLVAYQTAYDALGAQCDPSYTLAGGNNSSDSAETAIMAQFVANGDTVVVSDYEGENLAFGAGQQSGYGTLDGIRATEHALRAPASTPVAMIGYSGGSIASEFASELAPAYAPKLRIVGVAEGGIPVDFAHNLAYTDGSPVWSSTTPGIYDGLSRAFHLKLKPLQSPYGRQLSAAVAHQCLGQYLGKYPGLRVKQLFKPAFANPNKVPAFATVTNDLIMGRTGTPNEPLLMGVGNADGTGDGVMIANDVAALAHEYCQRGVNVTFHEYLGDDHTQAAPPFLLAAVPFLQSRLQAQAVPNGCASVPVGNSLAPLPVAKVRIGSGRPVRGGERFTFSAHGGVVVDALITLTYNGRLTRTVRLARLTSRVHTITLPISKNGRYKLTVSQAGLSLAAVGIALNSVVVGQGGR
jgi:secretory lipase